MKFFTEGQLTARALAEGRPIGTAPQSRPSEGTGCIKFAKPGRSYRKKTTGPGK